MNEKKELVSKDKLQEAAVYFGHKKDKWNPKMKPYIATIKKGTHILDVDKTKRTLEFAYSLVRNMAKKGAKFVFIGTKKQAKNAIKENALRTNSYHVTERWLGGTLTNSRTIFQRVRRMEELEKLQANNFEGYTKKEGLLFERELKKLHRNLNGIRTMRYKPNVMILADMASDAIAIKEAKRLGVKIISIADSNDDPSFVDVAIPANNDSIKSIHLIITLLADAIAEGKGGATLYAYKKDEEITLPEEPRRERKFPKNNFRRNSFYRNSRPAFRKEENKSTNSQFNKPAKKEVVKPNSEVKKEDLSEKTIVELKEMLKSKHLPTSGKKSELIERLQGE